MEVVWTAFDGCEVSFASARAGRPGTQGLALAIAAGLLNRLPDGPLFYPQMLPNDDLWLASLKQDYTDYSFTNITAEQLLQQAVKTGIRSLQLRSLQLLV